MDLGDWLGKTFCKAGQRKGRCRATIILALSRWSPKRRMSVDEIGAVCCPMFRIEQKRSQDRWIIIDALGLHERSAKTTKCSASHVAKISHATFCQGCCHGGASMFRRVAQLIAFLRVLLEFSNLPSLHRIWVAISPSITPEKLRV